MATERTEEAKQLKNMVQALDVSESRWEKIAEALGDDIARARGAREGFDAKIIKWDKQYEAEPDQDSKSFPWKNASNVVAPLIGIDVDAVAARVIGAVVNQPDMVQVKVLDPSILDQTKPEGKWPEAVARYLNHAARRADDLDTENCVNDLIPDTILNGIGFIKVPHIFEEEEIPEFSEDSGTVTYRTIVRHNGPKHVWVSITDVLYPEGTINIQTSRWFAQRFYLEWWEILERVNNPAFGYNKRVVDKLKKFLARDKPQVLQALDGMLGFTWETEERLELYEVYIKGDFEKVGDFKKYVVTIHPESGTIVKCIRHPFAHGMRPYVPFVYKKRRRSLIGLGMGKMLERLQDGITASLNQMVDNSTAANTVVLKVKKGALKPSEEIFPMKKLFIDGEMDDVQQFRLGENSSGMVNTINIMRDFGERRSGVTDYQLGMESTTVGTRATAAGTMSLIQEGNKQVDQQIRLFRLSMNLVWEMTVLTYQQFAPVRRIVGLLGPDAQPVIEAFTFPGEWLFDKIAVGVAQTSSSANKEIEKNNATSLFTMLMGYYEKLIGVGQLYTNPQLHPIAKMAIDKSVTALNELLVKILKTFDQYDTEEFLISFSQFEEKFQAMQQQMQQQQAATGGMPPGGPANAGNGNNGRGAQSPQGVLPQRPGMAPGPPMVPPPGPGGPGGMSPAG